ncbi:hypothetical protein [Staphylococcus phage PT1-9]
MSKVFFYYIIISELMIFGVIVVHLLSNSYILLTIKTTSHLRGSSFLIP